MKHPAVRAHVCVPAVRLVDLKNTIGVLQGRQSLLKLVGTFDDSFQEGESDSSGSLLHDCNVPVNIVTVLPERLVIVLDLLFDLLAAYTAPHGLCSVSNNMKCKSINTNLTTSIKSQESCSPSLG